MKIHAFRLAPAGSAGSADSLLQGLNDEQKQVAGTLLGPVVVRAGAGTGKTRVLTRRIAYGVASGCYTPEKVLALAFTRKAAGEMRMRLAALGADGVTVSTVHAHALSQLQVLWPRIVGGDAPRLLNSRRALLDRLAQSCGVTLGVAQLAWLENEITWRKMRLLGQKQYREVFADRPGVNGLSAELGLHLQESYTQELMRLRLVDFEDLLALLSGLIQCEAQARAYLSGKYSFFTVDEFQDFSPLQFALLRDWLGRSDNICAVGDASQTIYSFAGATNRYLLEFEKLFPGAKSFQLVNNYRSHPAIVAAANGLVCKQPGAVRLQACKKPGGVGSVHGKGVERVRLGFFSSEADEALAVADSIAGSVQEGLLPREIAVLYRKNVQAPVFRAALEARGLSVRLNSDPAFFDRVEVKQALVMIVQSVRSAPERALFQVVCDAVRAAGWRAKMPAVGEARRRWESLQTLIEMCESWRQDAAAFAEHLRELAESRFEPAPKQVTLSAIHQAKGLEWCDVYLVGVSEGILPVRSAGEDAAALAEERRIAYVAFTRAKERLFVSASVGKGRQARAPSRFIAEAGLSGRACAK